MKRNSEPRCPSSYDPPEYEDDDGPDELTELGITGARVVRSGGYWVASLGCHVVVAEDLDDALRRLADLRAAWDEGGDDGSA
jgi:hypothetical protein